MRRVLGNKIDVQKSGNLVLALQISSYRSHRPNSSKYTFVNTCGTKT